MYVINCNTNLSRSRQIVGIGWRHNYYVTTSRLLRYNIVGVLPRYYCFYCEFTLKVIWSVICLCGTKIYKANIIFFSNGLNLITFAETFFLINSTDNLDRRLRSKISYVLCHFVSTSRLVSVPDPSEPAIHQAKTCLMRLSIKGN